MEPRWALTTVLICLGMVFRQRIVAFLLIIAHSLLRATFNIFTLVGWTYLMFTAWSNMSQQCLKEFRFGKYARRGKIVNS